MYSSKKFILNARKERRSVITAAFVLGLWFPVFSLAAIAQRGEATPIRMELP